MNFLPSKTLMVAAVPLAFVCAVGIWYVTTNEPEPVGTLTTGDSVSRAVREYVVSRDTDKDGLFDWEEDLWKTDRGNPDTDGDGTPDGDEVREGRSPTIHGPDDLLANAERKEEPSEPLTTTDILARNIFSQYLSLKQRDALTEGAQENIIVSNLNAAIARVDISSSYEPSDIRAGDAGDAALRAYGNAVGSIVNAHSFQTENEAAIALAALEGDNDEGLAKLDPVIAAYRAIENDLLALRVPKEAGDAHLALLNAIAGVAAADEKLRASIRDPIAGLLGLKEYDIATQSLLTALRGLRSLFTARNVSFSEGTPGRSLLDLIANI